MKKEKPQGSRLKRFAVWIAVACLGVTLLVFGLVILHSWYNPAAAFVREAAATRSEESGGGTPAPSASAENAVPSAQPSAAERVLGDSNIVNVLLLGIDSDDKREAQNQGWRSDMVMLCTIDVEKEKMYLTSIPRDTRTYVYHVDGEGKPTQRTLTKINHAYSYGGGPDKFGALNAMRAVGDYLSDAGGMRVPVAYYVSIDLQNIPQLTDAFGGVPVTLDVDFPDLGSKGEVVTLDSSNVKLFLQNRYDVGGDLVRARHHEEFLVSLMKQFKEKGGISYSTALFSFAVQYTRTNLNFSQMVALASLLDRCDLEDMDYKVIAGEYQYIGGICYYLSDAGDVKNRLAAIEG